MQLVIQSKDISVYSSSSCLLEPQLAWCGSEGGESIHPALIVIDALVKNVIFLFGDHTGELELTALYGLVSGGTIL